MINRVKASLKILFYSTNRLKDYYAGAVRVLEEDLGHHKSVSSKKCVDKHNNEIPWFTYPAIEYLNQIDLRNKSILEWGGGSSSVYFCKRAMKVCTVEHDYGWYTEILKKNLKNHEVYYRENKEYVTFPAHKGSRFDVIVIDGIRREECLEVALKLVEIDGLIILDNSDRHPDLCKILRENDFIEVDMHGFGPINEYTWTTSFFFTRKFNFQPITKQPIIPIGGGY